MATKWQIDGPDIAEEVEALAILIRETDAGVLAFAMYQSVADREAAVQGIKERAGLPVEEVTLSKTRRDPIRELRAYADSTRRCVFFYDVEEALPDLAGYANLQREALREVPHPVVFWVREPGFREIAKNAPDFWSWRSGVFDFRTKQDSLSQATMQAVMAEPVEFLDRGDFDRRISLYEHLIREHEQQASPDTFFLARLHMKLTDALRTLGRYKDAESHARQTVGLCQAQAEQTGGDSASTQGELAAAYSNLAMILKDLGDLPGARREMERAIEIQRKHFEPDHPRLAARYNNLAHITLAEGDTRRTCDLLRQAYRILTKHFDAEHPSVRNVTRGLDQHCGGVDSA